MTDLRKMSLFRDVQVALDFQQMASEGYIDTEFTMYGTLYFAEGRRQYMVSANPDAIIGFIDDMVRREILALPMKSFTETCHVPLGEREKIAHDVKIHLARKLRDDYPFPFVEELQVLYEAPVTDAARPVLEDAARRCVNTFSAERLTIFEDLVCCAFRRKALTKESMQAFFAWSAGQWENLSEDIIPKDIMHKTWYTFLTLDKRGKRKTFTNARREWIYNKKMSLEAEGQIASPVFVHDYWYNNQTGAEDTRVHHDENVRRYLDDAYWESVLAIQTLPGFMDTDAFSAQVMHAREHYGEKAAEVLRTFGHIWRVL